MKLSINPSGGMAGDMFSAALISAGADPEIMISVMTAAGEKLGKTSIQHNITRDGSSQLAINLDSNHHHLPGTDAQHILTELFDTYKINDKYRSFGFKALDILIQAEKRAHKEFNIIMDGHSHTHSHSHNHSTPHSPQHSHHHHHHNHSEAHSHSHSHSQSNEHSHKHSHENGDALLHEAQDIIIDIMGAVTGLQLLNFEPYAGLTAPVNVGGGKVTFSHGTLDVPAPATFIILEQYRLPWQKGPIEKELFTPTGATLLAALDAKLADPPQKVTVTGQARGTKILPIPPLYIYA